MGKNEAKEGYTSTSWIKIAKKQSTVLFYFHYIREVNLKHSRMRNGKNWDEMRKICFLHSVLPSSSSICCCCCFCFFFACLYVFSMLFPTIDPQIYQIDNIASIRVCLPKEERNFFKKSFELIRVEQQKRMLLFFQANLRHHISYLIAFTIPKAWRNSRKEKLLNRALVRI